MPNFRQSLRRFAKLKILYSSCLSLKHVFTAVEWSTCQTSTAEHKFWTVWTTMKS